MGRKSVLAETQRLIREVPHAPDSLSFALLAAVAFWQRNRSDVFAQGSDIGIWPRWPYDAAWAVGNRSVGSVTSGRGAVTWGSNRIDLFPKFRNNKFLPRWWDGGRWTVVWREPLGGNLASAPAAVSQSVARLHIFARGANNQLLHEWWSGGQRDPWGDLGDIQTTEPIAFSCGRSEPTRVELVRREGPRPTPFDVILLHGQVGGPGALGQTERHSVQAALLLEVACDEGQRLRAASDVEDRSVGGDPRHEPDP